MANRWESNRNSNRIYFLGLQITAYGVCSHEIQRHMLLGRKIRTNLDSILNSRDITFPGKLHIVKVMGFSSSHVWMQELQHKESWALKNWWFWTVVLGNTLESPLDSKEIQPVHPKGNQSWIFIGWAEDEAEALVLWPTDAKNWLIGKDPDAGKTEIWGEGDNRGWVDWMASWLDRHEFDQSLGAGDGQESLTCCSPWGLKQFNKTAWLNWTDSDRKNTLTTSSSHVSK